MHALTHHVLALVPLTPLHGRGGGSLSHMPPSTITSSPWETWAPLDQGPEERGVLGARLDEAQEPFVCDAQATTIVEANVLPSSTRATTSSPERSRSWNRCGTRSHTARAAATGHCRRDRHAAPWNLALRDMANPGHAGVAAMTTDDVLPRRQLLRPSGAGSPPWHRSSGLDRAQVAPIVGHGCSFLS